MAVQTGIPKKAKGDAADTGTPITPAPSAELARSTSFGRENYGANAYDGRVVLDPGKKRTNDLLAPTDEVRDTIISRGGGGLQSDAGSPIEDQLRKIGAGNVPDAYGMSSNASRQHSRNAEGAVKVPAKTGAASAPLPSINAYKK